MPATLPPDVLDSELVDRLTLAQLARREGVSPPTTWRWMVRGVAGVKLPVTYIGVRPTTSIAAYRWWCAAVTAAKRGEPVATPSRTNRQRERDIAAAERELRAEGIL